MRGPRPFSFPLLTVQAHRSMISGMNSVVRILLKQALIIGCLIVSILLIGCSFPENEETNSNESNSFSKEPKSDSNESNSSSEKPKSQGIYDLSDGPGISDLNLKRIKDTVKEGDYGTSRDLLADEIGSLKMLEQWLALEQEYFELRIKKRSGFRTYLKCTKFPYKYQWNQLKERDDTKTLENIKDHAWLLLNSFAEFAEFQTLRPSGGPEWSKTLRPSGGPEWRNTGSIQNI